MDPTLTNVDGLCLLRPLLPIQKGSRAKNPTGYNLLVGIRATLKDTAATRGDPGTGPVVDPAQPHTSWSIKRHTQKTVSYKVEARLDALGLALPEPSSIR